MAGRLRAVSRRELVRRLGFDGSFAGGRHEFLVRGDRRLILPDPQCGEIGVGLLACLLDQAGVTREEWEGSAGHKKCGGA
ncbi:MAG: type II toxin-antitoxin system HicA family toxin [Anaerolineae bacterium]